VTSVASDQLTAFLFLDYREGICRPTGRVGAGGLAEEIVRCAVLDAVSDLLASARGAGHLVIHSRVAFDTHYTLMTSASPQFNSFRQQRQMVDGSAEAEICAELAPADGEPVITKPCVNPFIGTELGPLLGRLGARRLVLGGVATNHVVESTARHAADSGYSVVIAEDLCAGPSEDMHRFSVEKILPSYGTVLTGPQISADLTNRQG
jgi:nicotinamidase-related amidase